MIQALVHRKNFEYIYAGCKGFTFGGVLGLCFGIKTSTEIVLENINYAPHAFVVLRNNILAYAIAGTCFGVILKLAANRFSSQSQGPMKLISSSYRNAVIDGQSHYILEKIYVKG